MIEKREQIRQMHAPFIHALTKDCQNEEAGNAFRSQIRYLKEQGWKSLAIVAKKLLDGNRSETLLHGLDDEDVIIVSSVLDGIRNSATLPDPDVKARAQDAAPGLATIIRAASTGDTDALKALSLMSEQMSKTGGAMAEISGAMRLLVNGERDFDILSKKMSGTSQDLLIAILNELGKLTPQ